MRALGGWFRPWPSWRRVKATRLISTSCSISATTSWACSFCALGDGATSPISSSIKYFRDEYLAHLEQGEFDPAASALFADRRGNRMTTPEKSTTPWSSRPTWSTLTIDGIEVSVPPNTLVIRAAEQIGVQIPRFCDHPSLDPVGACRQRLVDVPDAGKTAAASPSRRPPAPSRRLGMVVNI